MYFILFAYFIVVLCVSVTGVKSHRYIHGELGEVLIINTRLNRFNEIFERVLCIKEFSQTFGGGNWGSLKRNNVVAQSY